MLDRLKGPLLELIDVFTANPVMRQTEMIQCIISFFAVAVIIFMVFPLRQFARGMVAKRLGDDTGEREGRLTLNPFSHIDPMGALLLCITCIGWPKYMPINYRNCTKVNQRTAVITTSLAGPCAGIITSYLLLIIVKIIFMNMINMNTANEMMYYIASGLLYVCSINMSLAIFHLLPIPPFDGCNILCCFLPPKGVMFIQRNGQIIHWVFFAVLIMGWLDVPLSWLSNGLMWLLDRAFFFVGMLYA